MFSSSGKFFALFLQLFFIFYLYSISEGFINQVLDLLDRFLSNILIYSSLLFIFVFLLLFPGIFCNLSPYLLIPLLTFQVFYMEFVKVPVVIWMSFCVCIYPVFILWMQYFLYVDIDDRLFWSFLFPICCPYQPNCIALIFFSISRDVFLICFVILGYLLIYMIGALEN